MADIAIVGLGNLGSRHLQGLASCNRPLRIGLVDPSPASLATARQRWEEVGGSSGPHQLLEHPLPRYDLAIIATIADARPTAVDAIANVAEVGAWLLEKPVSQSVADTERIARRIGDASAWVNLPRRVIPWHQAIAKELRASAQPLEVSVTGGPWGLACNATHFVDMVRWWTGAEPIAVDVGGLEKSWHASKRPGYVDVFGELQVAYSDGTTLRLASTPDGGPHLIDIVASGDRWRIAEGQGQCTRNDVAAVPGKMAFQSTLTGNVVEAIVSGQAPSLPTLAEAARFERVLLEALIPHRAAAGGPSDRLDIT